MRASCVAFQAKRDERFICARKPAQNQAVFLVLMNMFSGGVAAEDADFSAETLQLIQGLLGEFTV